MSKTGLNRRSPSLPSYISEFLVTVQRLLVLTPDVSSPSTKTIDENSDVCDDNMDSNEGLKDPGRGARHRPEEPWSKSHLLQFK